MITRNTDTCRLLTRAALLATCLLVAVAAFLPAARLWGINHLAYYPLPMRLLAIAMIAASWMPAITGGTWRVIVRWIEILRTRRRLGALVLAALPLLSLFLFLSLQSSTRILGDGQVVANDLAVPYRGDSTRVVPTLKAIARGNHIAPGTTMLFYLVGVAHLRLGMGNPAWAPQVVSCILGSVMVLLLLTAILRSGLPPPVAVWLLILACSSGTMELFFGYVENYAPLVVLGTLYTVLGIRVLHGGGRLWLVVVTIVAATFVHISGVLFAPSMGLLIWYALKRAKPAGSATVVTAAILTTTLMIITLGATFTPLGQRFFVPLLGSDSAYGFFSPARWGDLANEFILLMPLGFVVAVMAVALFLQYRRAPAAKSDVPVLHFVTLILVPQLIYLIFFNPEIGMGRDWDLFTPVSIGLVAFGVAIVRRFQAECPRAIIALTAPSLMLGLVVGAAWIGINASHARSTERFEHILDYTKSRRDYAYEVLSRTYYDNGMLPEAIHAMEKASTLSQNPRHYYTLSSYYREYGDLASSQELLRRLLVRRPGYLPARQEYVTTFFEMKDYEGALQAARTGLEYHPNMAFFHLCMGKALVRLKRPEEAREILLEGRALARDAAVARDIDEELERVMTD